MNRDLQQVLPRHSASDDLFGATAYPRIALIGRSYSRTSNFAGYLGLHLGLAVANTAGALIFVTLKGVALKWISGSPPRERNASDYAAVGHILWP